MRLTSQLSVFKQAQARGNAAKKDGPLAAEPMNDLVKADQKNPGNRGKGNGANVSNGCSQSARKNTASVSAEPTTNSTMNSLSRARLMTCNTNAAARNFTVGPPSAPMPRR